MRRLYLLFCLLPHFGVSKVMACAPEETLGPATASVRATAVHDGGTLVLADGREVRLAPVAVLRRQWRGRPSIPPIRNLASRAQERLAALVLNRDLVLAHAAPPDRYGRLRAQVFSARTGGPPVWVQAALVRAGLGRVETEADTRACAAALLALEARARAKRRGLWRLDLFAVRTVPEVHSHTGSYQIVEGHIRSIAEVRGRIYLNFGEDWRRDSTVSLASRAARLFPHGFWTDKARRRVRVRGWVESYNGPLIEATHPEQLEWPAKAPKDKKAD